MRISLIAILFLSVVAGPAAADPVLCQKQIAKKYTALKKKVLKSVAKCLDKDNAGTLSGPCPDVVTQAKLSLLKTKLEAKIVENCSMADFAALGFGADCNLDTPGSDVETDCAALPVTNSAEQVACISCWKLANFNEVLASLYASHAVDICDTLGATSERCAGMDCTTPQPDQRDLGLTGENDCQKAVGKAGIKYLLLREKLLEKCALLGGTEASCLADPALTLKFATAQSKRLTTIAAKCGNRTPQANLPFCCKTTGNNCVAAATRDDCENVHGGTVQENKVCGMSSNCDPAPGGQKLTWWETCPISNTCPGTPLTSINDVSDCVGAIADEVVSELMCDQFPRNAGVDWPCPAP